MIWTAPVGLAASLLAVASPAMAFEATPEIVVTGAPLAPSVGAEAYGDALIPLERLRGEASGRLENVLRDVAGVQQFRRADSRAANPTSQGVTLRALGGNAASRALLLLDGVPQADPFAGWIPWPALNPVQLSSARVIRGGGSGPFGAGALTGVIELESATPDEAPKVFARAAYGSRESYEGDVSIIAPLGPGFLTVAGGFDTGDGYELTPESQRGPVDVPAAYDQASISARAVAPLPFAFELQARAATFSDERLRGLVGATSTSDGTDVSVRLVRRAPWAIDLVAYRQNRRFTSAFLAANAERTESTPTLDQFDTPGRGRGAKLEIRPPVGEGRTLQIGFDARFAEGETNERFRFLEGAFTRGREAGGRTRLLGGYLDAAAELGPVTLTGGARVDGWAIREGSLREFDLADGAPVQDLAFADRSGTEATGRAGLTVTPRAGVLVRAAAYQGFRLPTLNELYRPFRVGADATAANAALDPERSRGAELGVELAPAEGLRLSATGFYTELEDAIANVTRGQGPGLFPGVGFVAGAFRVRENVEAIRSAGLEAGAGYAIGAFRLDGSYAFTAARVRAPGEALDGARPAQTPRHQASLTGGWRHERADLSLTVRYVGPQFEDDLEIRRLDDALTLDAVLAVPLKAGLTLELRGENLTDTLIQSGVSGAGIIDRGTPRTLWAGLRFEVE